VLTLWIGAWITFVLDGASVSANADGNQAAANASVVAHAKRVLNIAFSFNFGISTDRIPRVISKETSIMYLIWHRMSIKDVQEIYQ
jgi:hypothetical protein